MAWKKITMKSHPKFGEYVLVCGHGFGSTIGRLKRIEHCGKEPIFLFYSKELSGDDEGYSTDWVDFEYWQQLPKVPKGVKVNDV